MCLLPDKKSRQMSHNFTQIKEISGRKWRTVVDGFAMRAGARVVSRKLKNISFFFYEITDV